MTKIKFPLFLGALVIFVSLLFVTSAFAAAIFSPTLEEMKCRKISNTEERAVCHALIRKKEEEFKTQKAKSMSVGTAAEKVDFNNEQIDWRLQSCLRIYNPAKRELCFEKFRNEAEYNYQQAEKMKAETERQAALELQKNQQAFPLIIQKCEKLSNQRERMVCYAQFHQEQLQKQQQVQIQPDEEKKSNGLYSPTLARIRCQKLSSRVERNKCFTNLNFSERERKTQEQTEAIQNFDLDEELRKCYAINNDSRREDCLDDVEKLSKQVFDKEDEERDNWLND